MRLNKLALLDDVSANTGSSSSWLARTSGEHAVIPDSPSAEPYRRLARMAARALRAPIGMVTLLDGEREEVVASLGIDRTETAELDLPCDFMIDECGIERVDCIVFGDPLVMSLGQQSWRAEARRARSYIRIPLIGNNEDVLGSLCVVDYVSRRWEDEDVSCLLDLADAAMTDAACRLRESEERYQRLISLSNDAVLVQLRGRVVYANAAAAALLGVKSPAALEHRPMLELVHEDDREAISQRTRFVLANRAPSEKTDFRFVRPDGSVVAAEVSGTCIPYRGSDAVLIVCRDISERKATDFLLQMSEQQIQAVFSGSASNDELPFEGNMMSQLLEGSPDFICLLDPQGRIAYLNAAARAFIGLGPDAPLGHLVEESLYPAKAMKHITGIAVPTALIEGSWCGDSALICGDGSIRPMWQTIMAHRDANGALQMMSTVMRPS